MVRCGCRHAAVRHSSGSLGAGQGIGLWVTSALLRARARQPACGAAPPRAPCPHFLRTCIPGACARMPAWP